MSNQFANKIRIILIILSYSRLAFVRRMGECEEVNLQFEQPVEKEKD